MGESVRRAAPFKHSCHRAIMVPAMVLALIGVGGFAATAGAATGVPSSGDDARAAISPAAWLQFAQKTSSGDDLLTDKDELLIDKDELLIDKEADNAAPPPATAEPAADERQAREAHEALFAESRFPSAGTCGTCHPKQYREWSVSQHSYSQLSPVYLSLNNRILELTNGSDGDFCLRCLLGSVSRTANCAFLSTRIRRQTKPSNTIAHRMAALLADTARKFSHEI